MINHKNWSIHTSIENLSTEDVGKILKSISYLVCSQWIPSKDLTVSEIACNVHSTMLHPIPHRIVQCF